MRKLLLMAAILFIASCKQTPKDDAVLVKNKMLVALPVTPEKVEGMYAGDFKGSPISIVLNYVSNQHVSGYNVHKGLTRNIAGSIAFESGKLHLQLAEPGSNPYDGKFDLEIDTANWTGKGKWTPLNKGEETTFSVKKRPTKPEDEYDYGVTYIDSLSNYIILKPDGSCTYNEAGDTTKTGQLLIVRGNYQKDKKSVTIYWQKNDLFPSGKSVFKLLTEKPSPEDPDYKEESLKGEGRMFYQMTGD